MWDMLCANNWKRYYVAGNRETHAIHALACNIIAPYNLMRNLITERCWKLVCLLECFFSSLLFLPLSVFFRLKVIVIYITTWNQFGCDKFLGLFERNILQHLESLILSIMFHHMYRVNVGGNDAVASFSLSL